MFKQRRVERTMLDKMLPWELEEIIDRYERQFKTTVIFEGPMTFKNRSEQLMAHAKENGRGELLEGIIGENSSNNPSKIY